MQVATGTSAMGIVPFVCYLVQTSDGKNILIDTGLPESLPEGFAVPAGMSITREKNVVKQLALLGLQPDDIDMLIATHFDLDHAGCHALFTKAEVIVQRRHYEFAKAGHPRYDMARWQWDHPELRYRLVDGDTELLPGLELIESSGHAPGHQSVLVRLPKTGPVLLTIDAVAVQSSFSADSPAGPMDFDQEEAVVSKRKLIELAEREPVALVVFGHDLPQWSELKKNPEYYD